MSQKLRLLFSPQAILFKYDTESKIKQYLTLLKEENQKINLVSRETSPADFERLAAESLLPFEIIGHLPFQNYLDIGSGGGFPAFPIMISAKIGKTTLIERTRKKAAVLKRLGAELNLKVRVLDANFEECRFSEKFDLITIRLVKLTKPILNRISGLLKSGGTVVYYSEVENCSVNELELSSYSYTTAADSPAKSFTILTSQ